MGFYRPLFSLAVEHLYFSDGLWKGLDFVPDTKTLKLLEGDSILFKQTKNGISVFYDEDKARVLRLHAKDADGELRFNFKVYSRDRTFANYTALSSRKGNTVLCFNNRGTSREAASGKIRLSEDEFVSEKDFEEMDALIAEDILCERDRRLPPDFVTSFFIRPDKDGGIVAGDYGLKFNARQSFWKYHLLGNMNKDNTFIVDLDNRVEFEFCGDAMLQGNRPAKVFRSKELIPTLERSTYRFQLREQGPGAGKVLIKRLPVASESRLGMEVINGKNEIVSESFINY